MKTLNPSRQAQADCFTPQQKIEALRYCHFPSKGFTSAGEFVASMIVKLDLEENKLELTSRQLAYLDLLFWQYRHQHNRIREALKAGESEKNELVISRDGQQPDIFTKPGIERIINKDL